MEEALAMQVIKLYQINVMETQLAISCIMILACASSWKHFAKINVTLDRRSGEQN